MVDVAMRDQRGANHAANKSTRRRYDDAETVPGLGFFDSGIIPPSLPLTVYKTIT